jgi:TolB-like protein/DNA-binding winged helix-turn-helix (wHTH) protein
LVADSILHFENFALDLARRTLLREGRPVELRPKSFDVLACLARNAGRVVAKDELMATVWPGIIVGDDSLTRCISDVRAALGDAGQRLVKTVPRRGYLFAAPTLAGAAPTPARVRRRALPAAVAALLALLSAAAWWAGVGSRSEGPALSIVVLPLVAGEGDPRQGYLAEAVTEEITADLSRIPGSFVIGRSTADSYRGRRVDAREIGRDLRVRYVLEGSLAPVGDGVRLSLGLVDVSSGRALWTEQFDGELADLSALHRRVTAAVANSLQARWIDAASDHARVRRSTDLGAQDLALQAWSLLRRRQPADVSVARDLLKRAVERDARSALAWALLAHSYGADVGLRSSNPGSATRSEWLALGEQAADRAYALDPDRPLVLNARAEIYAQQGRAEDALVMLERLLALNRNDATAWFRRCYAHVTLGRQAEAIPACQEAVRLSPRDSNLAGFYVVQAAAHLYLGDDAQALAWARKSALEKPRWSIPHAWLASAAANLGDAEVARSALVTFRRELPQYTIASFRNEKLCANALCELQRERFYEGLRKSGLPE